jgi:peptidoglycan hydrolase CwlO-like protein
MIDANVTERRMSETAAAYHEHHIPVAVVEARLTGIESELRALRGLVERLVRVEERIANSQAKVEALQAELAILKAKIDTAASIGQQSSWQVGNIERLGWIVITALAAWATRFLD